MPNRHLVGLLLALSIAVVSASSVGAQPQECRFTPGITSYGVQVGAAHSDLRDQGSGPDLRMGPMFGGFAVFGFAPYFGLQAEVSYLERGTAITRLNYLQFAVLGRMGGITTPRDPNTTFMPHVLAGCGVSHRVNNRSEPGPGTADVSAIFGLGCDFRVGSSSRLTIGFRFDYGFLAPLDDHQNQSTIYSVGFSF